MDHPNWVQIVSGIMNIWSGIDPGEILDQQTVKLSNHKYQQKVVLYKSCSTRNKDMRKMDITKDIDIIETYNECSN